MGNRGRLHNDQKQLVKTTWSWQFWIICNLVHKDWHRELMKPNSYTELFFLDEAVALSAGHRPCAMCRNAAFKMFQSACSPNKKLTAPQIDKMLHGQRKNHWQNSYPQEIVENLPDGTFIRLLNTTKLHLKHQNSLLEYHQTGYQNPLKLDPTLTVQVLTPALTINALRNGFEPKIHPSAFNL